MTGLSLHYLPENNQSAERLAGRLGIIAHAINVHRFPDGECRVRVIPVTGNVIIFASLNNPNEKLIELLLAASAFKDAGATRLVLVAPYLCYMRQDKAFEDGEAVSQRVVADFLAARFDRIVTVDPHLHRIDNLQTIFTNCKADSLSAAGPIAAMLEDKKKDGRLLLVGPDAESAQWVGRIAAALSVPFIVGTKQRLGDRQIRIDFADKALVQDKKVVIVDDVISSGATLCRCAEALKAAGASDIEAVTVHMLAGADDIGAMMKAGIARISSTDSVPHPSNKIQLSSLLEQALKDEKPT